MANLNKCFFLLSSVVLFFCPLLISAKQFTNQHKYYQEKAQEKKIRPKYILGNLVLTNKLIITGQMIKTRHDFGFLLGTFCAYIQDKGNSGRCPIRVTSQQGQFSALGSSHQGNLPYTLYINGIKIKYGTKNYIKVKNRSATECQALEKITIHFSHSTVRHVLAGAYKLSLNFSAG